MLRLEKTSTLSNLAIRMRERERFFEPRLLKALAIALILHSGALILFHITPFSFASTFTFPPVHVQSDSAPKGVSALAYHLNEEEEMNPPPISLIPALDWISFSQESTLAPTIAFNSEDLKSLEDQVWPKWEDPLSLKLEEPRIQLAISGDLAELPIISTDPLLNQMQAISSHHDPAYIIYQVQLDEKKGEIFWYERTLASIEPSINQLTEEILLNLRFPPILDQTQTPVIGTLTFIVLENVK